MHEDTQEDAQQRLFSKDELAVKHELPPEPETDTGSNPVWTDNKARFIMLYLRYFVYITHHGTYIDGFAGPQAECETESWAAKLVLESKPQWIRHLHLCDANRAQVKRLRELKAAQLLDGSQPANRNIHVYHGDFNAKIDQILNAGTISEKEATFCLLDQRTFECDWQTVEKLARYKKSGNKIELFYFLANGWLERALSGQKNMNRLARWWGREDWTELRALDREGRRDGVVHRLKADFGYQSVKAYPIFKREGGGAIMYMIHATDHPEGPSRWPAHTATPYVPSIRPRIISSTWSLVSRTLKAPESQQHEPLMQLTA